MKQEKEGAMPFPLLNSENPSRFRIFGRRREGRL